MSDEHLEFIRGAIDKIEKHLAAINGRCMNHSNRLAIVETVQTEIKDRMATTRSLALRILGSVIAAIILTALGFIFGKNV